MYTLTNKNTGEITYLNPTDYSTEWTSYQTIEVEMADGTLKTIRKPKQNPKIEIQEYPIPTDRKDELKALAENLGIIYEFQDAYGNVADVIIGGYREPDYQVEGLHTVVLSLIVKKKIIPIDDFTTEYHDLPTYFVADSFQAPSLEFDIEKLPLMPRVGGFPRKETNYLTPYTENRYPYTQESFAPAGAYINGHSIDMHYPVPPLEGTPVTNGTSDIYSGGIFWVQYIDMGDGTLQKALLKKSYAGRGSNFWTENPFDDIILLPDNISLDVNFEPSNQPQIITTIEDDPNRVVQDIGVVKIYQAREDTAEWTQFELIEPTLNCNGYRVKCDFDKLWFNDANMAHYISPKSPIERISDGQKFWAIFESNDQLQSFNIVGLFPTVDINGTYLSEFHWNAQDHAIFVITGSREYRTWADPNTYFINVSYGYYYDRTDSTWYVVYKTENNYLNNFGVGIDIGSEQDYKIKTFYNGIENPPNFPKPYSVEYVQMSGSVGLGGATNYILEDGKIYKENVNEFFQEFTLNYSSDFVNSASSLKFFIDPRGVEVWSPWQDVDVPFIEGNYVKCQVVYPLPQETKLPILNGKITYPDVSDISNNELVLNVDTGSAELENSVRNFVLPADTLGNTIKNIIKKLGYYTDNDFVIPSNSPTVPSLIYLEEKSIIQHIEDLLVHFPLWHLFRNREGKFELKKIDVNNVKENLYVSNCEKIGYRMREENFNTIHIESEHRRNEGRKVSVKDNYNIARLKGVEKAKTYNTYLFDTDNKMVNFATEMLALLKETRFEEQIKLPYIRADLDLFDVISLTEPNFLKQDSTKLFYISNIQYTYRNGDWSTTLDIVSIRT